MTTDEGDGRATAPKGKSPRQKSATPKFGRDQAKKAKSTPVKETSSTSTTLTKKGNPCSATPKSAAKSKAQPKKAPAKLLELEAAETLNRNWREERMLAVQGGIMVKVYNVFFRYPYDLTLGSNGSLSSLYGVSYCFKSYLVYF